MWAFCFLGLFLFGKTPLMYNFININDFFKKIKETYKDPEFKHATLLKICFLVQGKLSAFVYSAEFHPVAAELD